MDVFIQHDAAEEGDVRYFGLHEHGRRVSGVKRRLDGWWLTRSRAGAVGIVKCVKLPNLGVVDSCKSHLPLPLVSFLYLHLRYLRCSLDDEISLFVWDIAESTVTIMAACFPALRIFIREKVTSRPSDAPRTTRLSQFSLSFRSANRNRRMFATQDIDVIREENISKEAVFSMSGASGDGESATGSGGGSGSGSGVGKRVVVESALVGDKRD